MEPIVIDDDEIPVQKNNNSCLIYTVLFYIILLAFVCLGVYVLMLGNIKDPDKKLTTQELQTLINQNPEQYNKFVGTKRSEQSFADWKAGRSEQSSADWKARIQEGIQQQDPSKFGDMGIYYNFG